MSELEITFLDRWQTESGHATQKAAANGVFRDLPRWVVVAPKCRPAKCRRHPTLSPQRQQPPANAQQALGAASRRSWWEQRLMTTIIVIACLPACPLSTRGGCNAIWRNRSEDVNRLSLAAFFSFFFFFFLLMQLEERIRGRAFEAGLALLTHGTKDCPQSVPEACLFLV